MFDGPRQISGVWRSARRFPGIFVYAMTPTNIHMKKPFNGDTIESSVSDSENNGLIHLIRAPLKLTFSETQPQQVIHFVVDGIDIYAN